MESVFIAFLKVWVKISPSVISIILLYHCWYYWRITFSIAVVYDHKSSWSANAYNIVLTSGELFSRTCTCLCKIFYIYEKSMLIHEIHDPIHFVNVTWGTPLQQYLFFLVTASSFRWQETATWELWSRSNSRITNYLLSATFKNAMVPVEFQ